jgi:3-oxoacyl-[acyl-carrier-protein] synthase II
MRADREGYINFEPFSLGPGPSGLIPLQFNALTCKTHAFDQTRAGSAPMAGKPGRRVAITGLGPITSIGIGKDAFWSAALAGRSGTRALEYPWNEPGKYNTAVGAPVLGFEPEAHGITAKNRRILDPVSCYALAGARLALKDAGLPVTENEDRKAKNVWKMDGYPSRRVAVILGTGIGGLHTFEQSHTHWVERKSRTGAKRYFLPMIIPNAMAAQIAIWLGARAECKAIATACAAGTMAAGDAYRLIRDGEADMAITGGVDGTMSDFDGYCLMGFDLLKTVSTWPGDPARASRPFDRDRQGFVLGEGAGMLVLEEMEQAKARGARIYAELAGYHSTCDAHSMMQLAPEAEEIVRMMTELLEETETAPGDVDYINAHATSTQLNDPTETAAIRRTFGPHADRLLVTATKSMTGHAIGASGGIEAIATALTIHTGKVHPTINLDHPDPACDLNYLPWEACERRVQVALSNSYGFGGHNASLLFRIV